MSALDALPQLQAIIAKDRRTIEIAGNDFPEWVIEELHLYWAKWPSTTGLLTPEQLAEREVHKDTIRARYHIEEGTD